MIALLAQESPTRPVAIADTGASNALITSIEGNLPPNIHILHRKPLSSPVRIGTASDNQNEAKELLVVAIYTAARFIPGVYYCSVVTCLHLALPRSDKPVNTVFLLAINKMNLHNISLSMPAAGTTLLFALDEPASYCSSPPGFNRENDRQQTAAGHLRSSVVTLAANGLPLVEHVPIDEIKAKNGKILTFDTCQKLDNQQLNRLIQESLCAFRTRRTTATGRSAALSHWDTLSPTETHEEAHPPVVVPDTNTIALTSRTPPPNLEEIPDGELTPIVCEEHCSAPSTIDPSQEMLAIDPS